MDLRGCLRLCTIDCSVGEFVMQENQSTITGGASCTFQPQGPHNINPTSRVARYIITASTGAHPPPMQHPESAQPTLYHVSRLTSHRILHRNDHGAFHLSEAHMTCWSQLSSSFPRATATSSTGPDLRHYNLLACKGTFARSCTGRISRSLLHGPTCIHRSNNLSAASQH